MAAVKASDFFSEGSRKLDEQGCVLPDHSHNGNSFNTTTTNLYGVNQTQWQVS